MRSMLPSGSGLTPSSITPFSRGVKQVGTLTPVHIDTIVKQRNLDYLQSLGEQVESFTVDPLWFDQETSSNKLKFLQVYQLSINYTSSCAELYDRLAADLAHKLRTQQAKLDKMKADILEHRNKTSKMRKNYQKQRLLFEKQKALRVQGNLRQLRNQLRHQLQLEAKHQISIIEEKNPYHPYAYYADQPYSPNPNPYYQPPPYPTHSLQDPYMAPAPQAHIYAPPRAASYPVSDIEGAGGRNQGPRVAPEKTPEHRIHSKREEPGAKVAISQNNQQRASQPPANDEAEFPQSLHLLENTHVSIKQQKNTKAFQVRASNNESEKNDRVDQLVTPLRDWPGGFDSKIQAQRGLTDSSQFDVDSLIQLKLKIESNNQLNQAKKNKVQNKTSIGNDLGGSSEAGTAQVTASNYPGEGMVINVTESKKTPTPAEPGQLIGQSLGKKKRESISLQPNYLEQSNQGLKYTGDQFVGLRAGYLKIRQGERLGGSILDSMVDKASVPGDKISELDYPDDFQLIQNTRVRIVTDGAISSPEPHPKKPEFVALFMDYFILKENAKYLVDSVDSGLTGSMRDFNYNFMGVQRKVTEPLKASKAVSFKFDLDEIEMPEHSVVARPSKLKQSTIRKSTVLPKKPKPEPLGVSSRSGKSQRSKVEKDEQEKQSSEPEHNFTSLANKDNLSSRVLRQTKNLRDSQDASRQKSQQLRKSLQKISENLIQSHVINQEIEEKVEEPNEPVQYNQSIDLTTIQQSQNQSFMGLNSFKQKVKQLLKNKFNHKSQNKFDQSVIVQQINKITNGRRDMSFEQITLQLQQKTKQRLQQLEELTKKREENERKQKLNKIKTKNQVSAAYFTAKKGSGEDDLLEYSTSFLDNRPESTKLQPPPSLTTESYRAGAQGNKNAPATEEQRASKFARQAARDPKVSGQQIIKRMKSRGKYNKDDELENINEDKLNLKKEENAEEDDEDF